MVKLVRNVESYPPRVRQTFSLGLFSCLFIFVVFLARFLSGSGDLIPEAKSTSGNAGRDLVSVRII